MLQNNWFSRTTNNPTARHVALACGLLLTFFLILRTFYSSSYSSSNSSSTLGRHNNVVGHKLFKAIQNSTLGFEKIFAINLPERTDHHDGLVLASSVCDLDISFVAGVHGDQILDKVLPITHAPDVSAGTKGAWRAHINAISRVLEDGINSALIIEDDVDWDINLRDQLQDLAVASRYLLTSGRRKGLIKLQNANSSPSSPVSSYGDGWDVLWLGHCGMDLPQDPDATMILIENDETVVPLKYQYSWDVKATSPLSHFPEHSRIIAEQQEGTCSLAYGVSRRGAQKLLLALGLRRMDKPFDIMLREWCEAEVGGIRPVCIGIHPALFEHHRRIGSPDIDSDISPPNGGHRDRAFTNNIRWSVRLNIDKLLRGETDYEDQWPDS